MRSVKIVRMHTTGGPEVLRLEEAQLPGPRPHEARVRLEVVGVNFIDVNHRSGAYAVVLPFTPGSEGAGVVIEAGENSGVKAGDRVVFAMVPHAYAEEIIAPGERLVPIPDEVTTEASAAVMLQGMTAHCLLESAGALTPGSLCVVHAAAGGVGLLLTQMARRRGLRVIGTVSSRAKAQAASAAGAEHVVVHTERDFGEVVDELSGGEGARAVFDAIGKDTFERSLGSLGSRGRMVLYGQASGPPPLLDPRRLGERSLFLTRPLLAHYIASRRELMHRAEEVLDQVARGELNVLVHGRYRLGDAAVAHADLASRRTTGKLLLLP